MADDVSTISTDSSNINKSVGFRFKGKKVGLTFPQCPLSLNQVLVALEPRLGIKQYTIARELHKDGNQHIHAYFLLDKELDTKNARFFDIDNFHPNIIHPQKGWESYIMKNGQFIHNEYFSYKHTGFTRRYADFQARNILVQNNTRQEIQYPVTLFGHDIQRPDPAVKKRHVWILGPPDMGKTYKVQQAFAEKKVFITAHTDYPYETYNGEEIIIIDDRIPKFEELAAITNTYQCRSPIYGKTRYFQRYWPLPGEPGHCRTVIVLTNTMGNYGTLQDAVNSRFQLIDLYTLRVPEL